MRGTLFAAFLAMAAGLAPARADEEALVGKWRIETVKGANVPDAAKTSFELLPDGRMATTLGCNRMFGASKIHGETISFGPVAGTRMACPPPLDELEWKYSAALEAARSFRRDGAQLILADAKGETVVVFHRAD